jgi:CBS domain-containing protein
MVGRREEAHMIVSDILRSKGTDVVSVGPEATVASVAQLMARHCIGAVVVSADGSHVDGVVSERNVVMALALRGADALNALAREICTPDVAVTHPGDSIENLMEVMTERRLRHLPVVVDGRLSGMVSIGDVVKLRLSELDEERSALARYITGTR